MTDGFPTSIDSVQSQELTPTNLTENLTETIQPSGRVILSLDSQILSKICACNQQAAYRHIDNIEPIDYNELSLHKGLLVHEMLAYHYKHKHEVPYNLLVSGAIGAGEAFAPKYETLTTPVVNECIDAYTQYAKEYQYENWKVKFYNGEPLVEKTFSKVMYESPELVILYTGVTDLVIDASETVSAKVDHKTFSSWYKAQTFTNQFYGYMWASGIRNLIVNRIGLGKKLGQFDRISISVTAEALEEWRTNAILRVMNHYQQMQDGIFMKNYGSACTDFGGCRYLRLCKANPEHRAYLIKTEYKKVPVWSPLNRD